MSAPADVHALSHAAALDLAAYREEHVAERVRRALARERVPDESALAALLRQDRAARDRFRRSVAVSVSGLWRDPAQFAALERDILPPLVSTGRIVSVWSAGCADGSELYSVALLLERLGGLERARLLGSDVLEENLDAARAGRYGGVTLPRAVRLRARWELRDLTRDGAPPGRWDVVLCRNMAIYLSPAPRAALHATLAGALTRRGTLVLGRSERIREPRKLGLERVGPSVYRRAA